MRRIAKIILFLALLGGCPRAPAQEIAAPPFNHIPAPPAQTDPSEFTTHGYCLRTLLYESPYEATYFRAETVSFRRDWERSAALVTQGNSTNEVLGTHDLAFTYQPGLSLLFGQRISPIFAIEVGFLGLLKWDEMRTVQNLSQNSQGTAGNLFSAFTNFGKPPQVGLDYNTTASIHTVSQFNTGEINLRQRFITPASLMQASGIYGFRYMNVHDRFEYRSRSLVPSPAGTDNAADVTTNNNLFGVQVGCTVDFHVDPRGWITFEGKGFMCHNSVNHDTQYSVGPIAGPDSTLTTAQSKGRSVFGADVQGAAVWKFTPAIVGRVGYQCIFMDGLALAADNFARNGPLIPANQTETFLTGRLAFHGPFAGLTVTW